MKMRKLKMMCALALVLVSTGPVYASTDAGISVAVDAVVIRPVCLVATVLGCAFFVIALPFSASSHSIKQSADALIGEPFDATFTRPMGDFDTL